VSRPDEECPNLSRCQASRTPDESVRILFLSDTHLGFDRPLHPRVKKRRRGEDFFRNFRIALEPARCGKVDAVVHGGDVFFRARIPPGLVLDALDCLRSVTELGVPVFIVPGNHERAALPYPMFWNQPGIHVFDRPRTFRLAVRDRTVAISGFPFVWSDLRQTFPQILSNTRWMEQDADIRLLCLHQACEGATVGPSDFCFYDRADTIPGSLIPSEFAAVLSGHIHRHQVLRTDREGGRLGCPVIYPGSVERTSMAERGEEKGFLTLQFAPSQSGAGCLTETSFHRLPTRPMVVLEFDLGGVSETDLRERIRRSLRALDPSSIVRIRSPETIPASLRRVLSAPALRSLAPETMTVDLGFPARSRAAEPSRDPTVLGRPFRA